MAKLTHLQNWEMGQYLVNKNYPEMESGNPEMKKPRIIVTAVPGEA